MYTGDELPKMTAGKEAKRDEKEESVRDLEAELIKKELKMRECQHALNMWMKAGQMTPLIQNTIMISRIPKDMGAESLGSIVVAATQMVPKEVRVCARREISFISHSSEPVGLIYYKTENIATLALEKMRQSSICRGWKLELREGQDEDECEKNLNTLGYTDKGGNLRRI